MTVDTQHRTLCQALFDALEAGDVEGVEACYAPDMTMWITAARYRRWGVRSTP